MTNLHSHGCVCIVSMICLCIFALWCENNQSRSLYVPKREYIRVLSSVLNAEGRSAPIITSDDSVGSKTQRLELEKRMHRKDSFYYLLRQMQRQTVVTSFSSRKKNSST